MQTAAPITTLFIDVGGVLRNNGWDRPPRRRAAFDPNWEETPARHHLLFEIFEIGRLSLDDFLTQRPNRRKRSFTFAAFRKCSFGQSIGYPEVAELTVELKRRYGPRLFFLSNESRERKRHRSANLGLNRFADCFVASCFVGLRKPDVAPFKLTLNRAQMPAASVIDVAKTAMFVDAAAEVDVRGIALNQSQSTGNALARFGLCAEIGNTS